MRLINRYIGVRLAFGWLLVFLILTALFSILELVGQLGSIGKGTYQLVDAFKYVAYTLPGRVLNLAAVSSLLGSIVALGSLARGNELLALRTCGVSVLGIARSALRAGSVIMLGTLLLAQFVVPSLERQAKVDRELALSGAGSLLPTGGFWARDNQRFINVRSSMRGGVLVDISIYEFDREGKLATYITAREAVIGHDGQWIGKDARQIDFVDQRIIERAIPTLPLDLFLNRRQVEIFSITPTMLSIDQLYQYIVSLRDRGQNADRYVLALWQKTTLPLKIAAMIFFSLPFVFGAAREVNAGRRVTLGAIVGISYYYFDQALGYAGLLLGLSPAFTTLLPLAIITLMTVWLLLRVP